MRYERSRTLSVVTAWLTLVVALSVFALCLSACNEEPSESGSEPVGAAPKPRELPKFELRDDTPGLLLTYVDDKGDFHVVQKVADVPEAHRQKVRVVMDSKPAGTKDLVYVADLRKKEQDGTYPVSTMSRSAWDEIGAKLRQVRMEALAPSAAPAASDAPSGEGQASASKTPLANNPKIVAIVYGADWCKPCHEAEAYLKRKGVTVVKKDVDESEIAAKEMQNKLQRAGRAGASIPVIDVMGQILVGYSPAALDQAVRNARNAKTL